MKKLFSTLSITLALFAPAFAQSEPASAPTANIDVTVQAPAQAPAPPAAPNVNVDVSAPAAPAAPSSVETHTSNSETKIVDHTTSPAPSDNTGLMVLGGVVGILALGTIMVAANKSA